jgi:hypothetical protein
MGGITDTLFKFKLNTPDKKNRENRKSMPKKPEIP